MDIPASFMLIVNSQISLKPLHSNVRTLFNHLWALESMQLYMYICILIVVALINNSYTCAYWVNIWQHPTCSVPVIVCACLCFSADRFSRQLTSLHVVYGVFELLVGSTSVPVDLPDTVHQVATEHSQYGDHKGQQNEVETRAPTAAAACHSVMCVCVNCKTENW